VRSVDAPLIGRVRDVGSPVVVASNRGPVSFTLGDDGSLTMKRGAGGLVSALQPVMARGEATWVCAALGDGDRQAASAAPSGHLHEAGHDTAGAAVRMLALDPLTYARAYNGIANGTLWFVMHHLYDSANSPTFDLAWRRLWDSYVEVNEAFADAIAEETADGGAVVVQDYHLFLVPQLLRARRPDVRIGLFTHTPWADPAVFSMLPDDIRSALVNGLLGADSIGFHTQRWADAFLACADAELGPDDTRTDRVRIHPIGVDADELQERAAQPDVHARLAGLQSWAGDRRVVLRIDRTELSKNIVRGLAAFRELLRTQPDWCGKVVHLAFAYPSRHDLPEYREYTATVQRMASAVNDEFATPGWEPVHLEVSDDYPRSLAALSLADVLLVNPVRDGMNLVAKEGPVLSKDGCALVLSREAGAVDELGADALLINPFDVSHTAAALHEALVMSPDERAARCTRLAAAAAAHPPRRWLADQLAALGR
jgi:trehalose 6-phosphate synthase